MFKRPPLPSAKDSESKFSAYAREKNGDFFQLQPAKKRKKGEEKKKEKEREEGEEKEEREQHNTTHK